MTSHPAARLSARAKGALCLGALGAYGSIKVLMNAFANGSTNSFVCQSPLDG